MSEIQSVCGGLDQGLDLAGEMNLEGNSEAGCVFMSPTLFFDILFIVIHKTTIMESDVGGLPLLCGPSDEGRGAIAFFWAT